MGIFDIIGPVMVGPSSSHTAGAARIGFVARNLLGEDVKEARILLYGSFLATGKGHGTDKALVAGLLGMSPDDGRIADSLRIAEEKKVGIEFGEARLKEGHPNIAQIDGIETNFSGENPTLIVHNQDQPGHVAEVTSMLAQKKINIATLQLYRSGKGGRAVMVVECDQDVPEDGLEWLEKVEGIIKVTYLKKAGGR